MLAMKSASRYLQELVSLGVLREMSFGREKLFVHPKLMSLLINDSNEFDLYVSSPTTRFKKSDKAQKPAKILRSSGFLCFIGFLRIVFWCQLQDSNPPPHDYKSCALPDELSWHFLKKRILPYFTRFKIGPLSFFCGLGSLSGGVSGSVVFLLTSNAMPCPFSLA